MLLRTLFFVLMVSTFNVYGQSLNIGVGYNNLWSRQFDRLIRTYNDSRPFLEKKQPFLSHGLHANVTYLFDSDKGLEHGITANFSRVISHAENENLDVLLSFNMIELGYIVHQAHLGNLYGELGVNIAAGILSKHVNAELLTINGETLRSFHIGGAIGLKLGYLINPEDRVAISPYAGVHFSPYFTEGNSETIINQTDGIITEVNATFLKFDIGMRIHILGTQ